MRIHVILPSDLVERVDKIAGKRRRSRYVEEAVREKLTRDAVSEALRTATGSLDPSQYPEWRTGEDISRWVHELRRQDERLIGEASSGTDK